MLSLFRVSWRSVWRHRRRTLITVSAITLSLAAAEFSIAFADGSYHQLIESAVRIQAGHVTLEHPQYRDGPAVDLTVDDAPALRRRIQAGRGVAQVKLLVLGQGVAQSARDAIGVAVVGVEPEAERRVSVLARKLVAGAYLDPGGEKQAVIGRTLADRLKVDVGKKLVLMSNDRSGVLVQELVRIKGIFSTGADELDGYLVQVPLGVAQRFYGLRDDQVTQIGVIVDRSHDRDAVLERLRRELGRPDRAVLPWEKVMPDLAAYIRLDGGSNLVLMGVLVFLSLFTVLNTIVMSVLERTREFAVMLALGTPAWRMRGQLLVESALIGGLGVLCGLTIGGLAGYWLQVHGFDLSSVYPKGLTVSGIALDPRIYGRVTAERLAGLGSLVFLAAVGISLLSTRRLSSIPVSQVLR